MGMREPCLPTVPSASNPHPGLMQLRARTSPADPCGANEPKLKRQQVVKLSPERAHRTNLLSHQCAGLLPSATSRRGWLPNPIHLPVCSPAVTHMICGDMGMRCGEGVPAASAMHRPLGNPSPPWNSPSATRPRVRCKHSADAVPGGGKPTYKLLRPGAARVTVVGLEHVYEY